MRAIYASLCISLSISLHFSLHISLHFSAKLHVSTFLPAYLLLFLYHIASLYMSLCIFLYLSLPYDTCLHCSLASLSTLLCGVFWSYNREVCVDTIEIRPAPKCLCRYNRNPTGPKCLCRYNPNPTAPKSLCRYNQNLWEGWAGNRGGGSARWKLRRTSSRPAAGPSPDSAPHRRPAAPTPLLALAAACTGSCLYSQKES